MMTKVKTAQEQDSLRQSGKMLATVLKVVGESVVSGNTTKDLAIIAAKELKSLGGKPAFLGYGGFPDVICISVNSEVVHGIPGDYELKDGDIISFDFGVTYGGMITDAARSIIVGKGDKQTHKLVQGTSDALNSGIKVLKDGVRVGDISAAIQKSMESNGFGIVRDLVGHGVGHQLHEDPNIPNYGKKNKGPVLSAGMSIAIEPMSTLGSYAVYTDADGWTVVTQDGSLSAHFEDTVLITETGHEVMTRL